VTLKRRMVEFCEAQVEVEAADEEAAEAAALAAPDDEDADLDWQGVADFDEDVVVVGVRAL
jgi:hypothetical protein